MSREEFLLRMKNITNMYSMPFKVENMQPIHYACREYDKLAYEQQNEIERLNNIINECADEILKELEENHHLSYGVALAIRQKLINYRELKKSGNNE